MALEGLPRKGLRKRVRDINIGRPLYELHIWQLHDIMQAAETHLLCLLYVHHRTIPLGNGANAGARIITELEFHRVTSDSFCDELVDHRRPGRFAERYQFGFST